MPARIVRSPMSQRGLAEDQFCPDALGGLGDGHALAADRVGRVGHQRHPGDEGRRPVQGRADLGRRDLVAEQVADGDEGLLVGAGAVAALHPVDHGEQGPRVGGQRLQQPVAGVVQAADAGARHAGAARGFRLVGHWALGRRDPQQARAAHVGHRHPVLVRDRLPQVEALAQAAGEGAAPDVRLQVAGQGRGSFLDLRVHVLAVADLGGGSACGSVGHLGQEPCRARARGGQAAPGAEADHGYGGRRDRYRHTRTQDEPGAAPADPV